MEWIRGVYSDLLKNEKQVLDQMGSCPQIIRCFGADHSVENGEEFYNLVLGSGVHQRWHSGGRLPESDSYQVILFIFSASGFFIFGIDDGFFDTDSDSHSRSVVDLHPHRPPPTAQPQLGFPELPGLKKRVFVQLGFQDSSSQSCWSTILSLSKSRIIQSWDCIIRLCS
ncbi:hypothetical protein ACFX19_023324 [Malus domestica]